MNVLPKIIMLISFSGIMQAQEIKREDLIGFWHIDKYEIFNEFHNPTEEDRDDYIFLKSDGSLVSQSEKVKELGEWIFDSSTKTLLLTDNNNESVKAKVVQLKGKQLVLSYQVKELEYVLFYYRKK